MSGVAWVGLVLGGLAGVIVLFDRITAAMAKRYYAEHGSLNKGQNSQENRDGRAAYSALKF